VAVRLASLLLVCLTAAPALAQSGKVFTAEDLFRRNVGTREQQYKQFPPHKVIGNIYYVGTETLASFLVTTPQGHILINTMFEGNLPTIRDSVEKLGCDVPLGSHPAMYNMVEKYSKLGKGPNPFIDPQGYKTEVDIQEQAFKMKLK
jgi:hypothetical protein